MDSGHLTGHHRTKHSPLVVILDSLIPVPKMPILIGCFVAPNVVITPKSTVEMRS